MVQDWDLSRFQANPVVLWNHGMGGGGLFGGGSDDSSLPIGYATDVRVEDGALMATLNFVDERANPIAEKVYQGFLQGSLRAVSVGWDSSEASYDEASDTLVLTGNTLIEISAVALPANPEAVKQAAAMFAEFRQLKGQTMHKEKASTAEAERLASLEAIEHAHADLLSLLGAVSTAEAQGVIAALKATAERTRDLETQLAAMLAEKREAEFAKVIEQARKEGKFVASNEAGLVAAAKGDVETLKAIVAHLHPVVNLAAAETPATTRSALSKAEEAKCRANGWDPQKYAETKQRIISGMNAAFDGGNEE